MIVIEPFIMNTCLDEVVVRPLVGAVLTFQNNWLAQRIDVWQLLPRLWRGRRASWFGPQLAPSLYAPFYRFYDPFTAPLQPPCDRLLTLAWEARLLVWSATLSHFHPRHEVFSLTSTTGSLVSYM